MLNKELHKDQVQSLKFKVQSIYENLTSAFGMQRHPELDSGSDTWGLELEACSYLSPQKPFAYEACLTYKRVQLASSPTQLSSNLPSTDGGDPGYPGEGVVSSANRATVFRTNNLNASTLIDLCYLFIQTQTERINFNKNRIDKQLILKKCQSTNKTKTFCDFSLDEIHEESQITLFEPCLPGAQISPHFLKGEYPGRRVGRRGFDSIRVSNPERINRTVLT